MPASGGVAGRSGWRPLCGWGVIATPHAVTIENNFSDSGSERYNRPFQAEKEPQPELRAPGRPPRAGVIVSLCLTCRDGPNGSRVPPRAVGYPGRESLPAAVLRSAVARARRRARAGTRTPPLAVLVGTTPGVVGRGWGT